MKEKIIIRVFSAFSGFDTQFIALLAYARWYNQNTNGPLIEFVLIGWCEIDKDAITCHNAIFPEAKSCHYSDITKVDWERVPDFDVLIYSSCCQSLTRAGSQKGMTEGSGTPSSLIWYVREAIKISKGSGKPNTDKVGTITKEQLKEIAEKKMEFLNAVDIEGAIKIVAGTARSMGVTVED